MNFNNGMGDKVSNRKSTTTRGRKEHESWKIWDVAAERRNIMKQSVGAKTLLFPTPVLMVGSYDQAGKANLMNAA